MPLPDPRTTDPRLPYALTYAANRWPVFGLGRSKRPLANCRACTRPGPGHDPAACACLTCHGFYAATTDPDRVRALLAAVPSGLLAIRTGQASRLVVVDIDPRNGGRLDPALMPSTLFAATASGGVHLYYRHPGGHIPSRGLPGVPGVDIKADGGYVVAPPSALSGGRVYAWAGSWPHTPAGVSEMPPALAERCQAPAPVSPASHPPTCGPVQPRHGVFGGGGISSPTALLTACLEALRRAPEGHRRATLYGAARGVARIVATGVVDHHQAWAELRATARQVGGITEREISAAILGGFAAEGVPTTDPDRKAG